MDKHDILMAFIKTYAPDTDTENLALKTLSDYEGIIKSQDLEFAKLLDLILAQTEGALNILTNFSNEIKTMKKERSGQAKKYCDCPNSYFIIGNRCAYCGLPEDLAPYCQPAKKRATNTERIDNLNVLEKFIEKDEEKTDGARSIAMNALNEIEEELELDDFLLESRSKLLSMIPPCNLHGDQCVPRSLSEINGGTIRWAITRQARILKRSKTGTRKISKGLWNLLSPFGNLALFRKNTMTFMSWPQVDGVAMRK